MVSREVSLETRLPGSTDLVDRSIKKSAFVYNVCGSQRLSGDFLYRLDSLVHVCDKV